MKNKQGTALLDFIMNSYRIILFTIVAVVVLGLSSTLYAYEVDVKDTEALLMTRTIIDCIAPEGIANLETLQAKTNQGLLEACTIKGDTLGRFFIRLIIHDEQQQEIAQYEEGDSGSLWVKKLYETTLAQKSSITLYKPGYQKNTYPTLYYHNQQINTGSITAEVFIHEI